MVTNLDNINKIELLVLAQPGNVNHCQTLSSLYKLSPSWQNVSMNFQQEGEAKKRIASAFYNAGYLTKQKGEYQLAIDFYMFALDFDI